MPRKYNAFSHLTRLPGPEYAATAIHSVCSNWCVTFFFFFLKKKKNDQMHNKMLSLYSLGPMILLNDVIINEKPAHGRPLQKVADQG